VDLSLGFREFAPPPGLADVVECVWVRVLEESQEVRVVPDACVDVIWQQDEGTTIAGPDTSAKVSTRESGDVLVGMRFRPGAGGPALGLPVDAIRDARVDIAGVNPAFDVPGDATAAEALARFAAAAAGRQTDPLIAAAARRLTGSEVRVVARDLGVSERQLLRRCRAAVGYGPKTLARILRFRRFVEAVDAGHADLSELAFDLGYSDQAHLTNETTRLAGLPPARLVRDRRTP
jgi:AraC-like DNA-binding protein